MTGNRDKEILQDFLGVEINDIQNVSGGDINSAARIVTRKGDYFMKYNSYPFGRDMLLAEERGLLLLSDSGTKVPKCLGILNLSNEAHALILEWLEPSSLTHDLATEAGRQLARQHEVNNDTFGLDHDNYLATFPQDNTFHSSWPEFYAGRRIEPLIRECIDMGLLNRSYWSSADALQEFMLGSFPKEKPALLHGDLWGGNLHPCSNGKCYFIDPAVFFGSREVDIAMTRLFGGFPNDFYHAYNEVNPLVPGWQDRLPYYQLYYLLYHLYKFGRSYLGQVQRILDRLG